MNKKLDKKSAREAVRNKKIEVPKGKRKTAARKRGLPAALARAEENPIISPRHENNWEAWQTFNPGVVLLEDKVHFLYRAIGEDGISRFGYAASEDGFAIDERLPYPIYEHTLNPVRNYISNGVNSVGHVFNYYSFASGGSFGGAEDPRIVRVSGEDTLYMTYTACDAGLRVALTSIKSGDFLNKKWNWKKPVLISPPGEVHKNWLIFPEKIDGTYAILTSISPEISIVYRESLEFQKGEYIQSFYDGNGRREKCWDTWIRGAGAPPIKTRMGWLLFYHAMDNDWSKYKVGVMLLDLHDPTKVLRRAPEPVLEPEASYENGGFKAGVVYVSGAVIKNGELLVYYGASDSFVGVAHAPLQEFLAALTKEVSPKLKARTLKKK